VAGVLLSLRERQAEGVPRFAVFSEWVPKPDVGPCHRQLLRVWNTQSLVKGRITTVKLEPIYSVPFAQSVQLTDSHSVALRFHRSSAALHRSHHSPIAGLPAEFITSNGRSINFLL
jgi:hypothetical protein